MYCTIICQTILCNNKLIHLFYIYTLKNELSAAKLSARFCKIYVSRKIHAQQNCLGTTNFMEILIK